MTLLASTKRSRDALAQSATFAMSLGAKELFHTNFLGFLLESSDPQLADIQKSLRAALGLPLLEAESSACAVWRERHNLDLVVVPLLEEDEEGEQAGVSPGISRCLVVEAKLKSLPTRAQLQDYMTKRLSLPYPTPESKEKRFTLDAEVVRRVLLTPTGVTVHEDWEPVAWESLCEALTSNLGSLSTTSKLRSILEDYADALKHVLNVVRLTRRRVEDALPTEMYSGFYDDLVHKDFRDLRLHDLTGKVAFDEWVTSLHADIKKEQERRGKTAGEAKPYVHFSRSQPGLDLETQFGDYNIGIQVQGTQLRRYVSSSEPRQTLEEEVLSDDVLMNTWLDGTCRIGKLTGVEGLPLRREDRWRRVGKGKPEKALSTLRAFNAKKFLYSAVELNSASMAEVHEEVIESMLNACAL